uniref:Ras-related protein Rab n=1 Tax=Macrostomum lignano TaxID=282301 RepID=A0A1I8F4K7_9PLAT
MEQLMKILVIGDPTVGKNFRSFIDNVNNMFQTDYKQTIGVDFALKVIRWSDTQTIKLQMWDIAGQERFTSMTRVYYRDAHAAVIVFDLTKRSTFDECAEMETRFGQQNAPLPDGSPLPAILLANKCDLLSGERQLQLENGFIGWTEVSAKEGVMIEEAMRFLIESVLAKTANSESAAQTVSLTDDPAIVRLGAVSGAKNKPRRGNADEDDEIGGGRCAC